MTLPEVLVAVLVGLLVLTGLHRIFVAGLTAQSATSLEATSNRSVQVGLDHLLDRLRGAYLVTDAGLHRITFRDVSETGQIRNHYYWVGPDRALYYSRTGYSNGARVASEVSDLIFTYLDSSGQPAGSADRAVRVVVRLRVEAKDAVRDASLPRKNTADLVSTVRLRNKS
jgi:phosphotransferase system  glucose/maltose/N-acetylglucosamine-specific IIC component